MSLSLLDAFGAAAAPGAPPPSALAGDGGPVDAGEQDAGFGTLLDAASADATSLGGAAAGSASDAAATSDAALVTAVVANQVTDPSVAVALQAKWWLSALATPGATDGAATTAADAPSEDAHVAPEFELDPDDNATAEWFIASGAVLTALVVADEPQLDGTPDGGSDPGTDVDGESPVAGAPPLANQSSLAYEVASRARHDAGVRRSAQPVDGSPSNDIAAAARAMAAERRDAVDAKPSASAAAAVDGSPAAATPDDVGAMGEMPIDGPPADGRSSVGRDHRSDRAVPNTAAVRAELPATASDVAKAVANLPETAQHGTEVAAFAAADGQARAEERRSTAAAARLANSIERGGGVTTVPSGAAAAHGDSGSTVPVVADESTSDAAADDQSSPSRQGPLVADGAMTAPPVRPSAPPTAGDAPQIVSPHPAAAMPGTVPVTASAATTSAPATATPNAETLPQLVQTMRLQYRAGGGDAVVRLNPEHLGAVSISLRVDRGVVSATVHAESPAVRQWLESHESSLREGLLGQGLHLDRFVVHRDGRQPEQRHYDDQQSQRRRMPRRQAGLEHATFEVRV